MPTEPSRIRLTGFRDARDAERVIDSCLVDIAYVDEVADDHVLLVPDVSLDFELERDFQFVKAIVIQVFRERLDDQVIVALERHSTRA